MTKFIKYAPEKITGGGRQRVAALGCIQSPTTTTSNTNTTVQAGFF